MRKAKTDQTQLLLPNQGQKNSIAEFTAVLWTNYLDKQLRDPIERSQVIVMVEILTSVIKSLESGQLVAHFITETKEDGTKRDIIVPPIGKTDEATK